MKIYQSDQIRNVGIMAHGGAGKTSLTEAMLFNSGATKRLGKVDDGNTVTDYLPEEIKRKVTTNTALAPCEWRDHKLNIVDTPGYADFIGDVKGALRVVDGVVMVICAVSGVEVQTEIIWEYAEKDKIPRLIFINKMDRENANFYRALEEAQEKLSGKIVPLQLPLGAEDSFEGVIDLLEMKAMRFAAGNMQVGDIPSEYVEQAQKLRETLVEASAEGNDDLLMKYLDGEELTPNEIKAGLRAGVAGGIIIPVLCGSALKNIGVQNLLNTIVDFIPSPTERMEKPSSELEKQPLAALVFKTLADPFVGKISMFKVFQGVFKPDITIFNTNKETEEKIGQIFIMQGKNQIPISELKPGDIGVVTKLQATGTGDTLSTKANQVILEGIEFPEPTLTVAIRPKSKGDEDKVGGSLNRLVEEDPTLQVSKNTETKETLLKGLGEMHLDITVERLQRKFGVEVETSQPKVPYRETIKGSATRVEGKHKKQSGGHGQYGHVFIDMSPSEQDFEFNETIFGGSVPRQYIPAVEKGIRESMMEGILAGYPVTNIKVTLTDGSYHTVDSSEMAFKIAAGLAFRKAMEQAKPVLLEPLMNVEITVPDYYMGDIIGDLNTKRGRILGMEPQGKMQIIKAQAPLSEMYRYAIDLKSITQGRGSFKMEFSHYEEMPSQIAEKVIAEAKAAKVNQ